jgi:hypothetical protein
MVLLAHYPGKQAEMLITAWSKGFECAPEHVDPDAHRNDRPVSVDDMAFEPHRTPIVAASMLAMLDAGRDGAFYYHIWDHVLTPTPSGPSPKKGLRSWSSTHTRCAIASAGLGRMTRCATVLHWLDDERLMSQSTHANLRVSAARSQRDVPTLITSFNLGELLLAALRSATQT